MWTSHDASLGVGAVWVGQACSLPPGQWGPLRTGGSCAPWGIPATPCTPLLCASGFRVLWAHGCWALGLDAGGSTHLPGPLTSLSTGGEMQVPRGQLNRDLYLGQAPDGHQWFPERGPGPPALSDGRTLSDPRPTLHGCIDAACFKDGGAGHCKEGRVSGPDIPVGHLPSPGTYVSVSPLPWSPFPALSDVVHRSHCSVSWGVEGLESHKTGPGGHIQPKQRPGGGQSRGT